MPSPRAPIPGASIFTLDPFVWDGLDYIATEQSTGDIVGFSIVSDQVWTFCEQVNGDFSSRLATQTLPCKRVEGRLLDKGCMARDHDRQA